MTIINILMRVMIRDLYDGFSVAIILDYYLFRHDVVQKHDGDADVSTYNYSNVHYLTLIPSLLSTICTPIYYQIYRLPEHTPE